jgi:hypothetical protein
MMLANLAFGYGESTLWWPKNIVIKFIFENFATFNFHQANIKRDFHKSYSK